MSHLADRFVVLLDANVLYPFRVRDALLRFAEFGLFRARWSAQIMDEWEAALLKTKPHLSASISAQRHAMAEAFPEAFVEGYEDLVDSLQLPDANDRHVLAAAIRAGAQHIVTENLKDFPAEVTKRFDIEAVTADTFLGSTYELYPSEATAALRKMRRTYRNPAMSRDEFLLDLMRVGLPKTAAMARREIDSL